MSPSHLSHLSTHQNKYSTVLVHYYTVTGRTYTLSKQESKTATDKLKARINDM